MKQLNMTQKNYILRRMLEVMKDNLCATVGKYSKRFAIQCSFYGGLDNLDLRIDAPGIGKSDTVRKLPAVLSEATGEDFGLVVVEASTLDAPDVIGFLVPTKDPDTGGDT